MRKLIYLFIFLIIPLLLLLISVLLYFSQKKLIIFPNDKYDAAYYDDSADKGNSCVKMFEVNENMIIMKYMLNDDYRYPYSGIKFQGINAINLKKYDRVKIKIKTLMSKNLFFHFQTCYQKNTSGKNINDYIILLHEIPVWKDKKEYIFRLKDFRIPEWWLENYGVSEYEIDYKKDLSDVVLIDISSSHYLPMNVEDTIIIEEISFYHSRLLFFIIFGLIISIYYLILSMYFIIKKIEKILIKKYSVVISYKSLDLRNYIDEDSQKLFGYLSVNFKNPNLTVQMTAEKTSLTVLKIPQIIKKIHNLSFPQYLNVLRIMEAKRILKETDEQIVNIAFQIGYNHLSHFNYIFRKMVKCSPMEYRKNNQKKITK